MDQEFFIESIRQNEDTYFRVAKSILHYDTDVEDAVQEGILLAYKKRNTLRDISCFRTWSTRIIMNECFRLLKKRKKEVNLNEDITATESVGLSDRLELYEALRSLPLKIRIVIVLYYIEGYSTAEIGNILHIPVGTVKSRLYKGRRLLKYLLEDN